MRYLIASNKHAFISYRKHYQNIPKNHKELKKQDEITLW